MPTLLHMLTENEDVFILDFFKYSLLISNCNSACFLWMVTKAKSIANL